MTYQVKIGGEYQQDDGLQINLGKLDFGQAWWEKELPQCPDCGGDIVWWEAGHVPGTRKCVGKPAEFKDDKPIYNTENGCGAFFRVTTNEKGEVILERERFF